MGNRALIACSKAKTAPAIYLHWNGGEESVLAFVHAARELGVRSPANDDAFFLARLGQIIGNFFGGSTSVGFGTVGKLESAADDNGLYVINGDFEIKERTFEGPKTVGELDSTMRKKYESIRDSIIQNQGQAFDESRYKEEIVIVRQLRKQEAA